MGEVSVPAVCGINLEFKKGEFIAITGPSGCGKSTMLNLLGALDKPTSGKIMIEGTDISTLNDNELAFIRGKKIGFIFQTFNLIPRLTALENVMLPMWFVGVAQEERKKRALSLLGNVGLSHRTNNRPSQLSGGERQRVAIARALANNPEIIVADEPTGNLDSKTGKDIMNLLKNIQKTNNITFILVTHDLDIARQAKMRIKMLDGKIVR